VLPDDLDYLRLWVLDGLFLQLMDQQVRGDHVHHLLVLLLLLCQAHALNDVDSEWGLALAHETAFSVNSSIVDFLETFNLA
jgi:hypothetical protein